MINLNPLISLQPELTLKNPKNPEDIQTISNFSHDLWRGVLSYLSYTEITRSSRVCQLFNRLSPELRESIRKRRGITQATIKFLKPIISEGLNTPALEEMALLSQFISRIINTTKNRGRTVNEPSWSEPGTCYYNLINGNEFYTINPRHTIYTLPDVTTASSAKDLKIVFHGKRGQQFTYLATDKEWLFAHGRDGVIIQMARSDGKVERRIKSAYAKQNESTVKVENQLGSWARSIHVEKGYIVLYYQNKMCEIISYNDPSNRKFFATDVRYNMAKEDLRIKIHQGKLILVGRRAQKGGLGKCIEVWDIENEKREFSFLNENEGLFMHWCEDSAIVKDTLYTLDSHDGSCRQIGCYDIKTGRSLKPLKLYDSKWVFITAVDNLLFTYNRNDYVHIRDRLTGRVITEGPPDIEFKEGLGFCLAPNRTLRDSRTEAFERFVKIYMHHRRSSTTSTTQKTLS